MMGPAARASRRQHHGPDLDAPTCRSPCGHAMSARPLRSENALAPRAEVCQGPAVTSLLDDMVDAHARWNAARLADWYPQEQRRARSREAMQGQAGWVADGAFGRTF